MANVIIFGTGRGADVAFRYLAKDSPHKICGFTVEKPYLKSESFNGLPVVDFDVVQAVYPPDKYKMFVPLGFNRMNQMRYEKYMSAKNKGYGFISYVSSSVKSIDEVNVGENCLILENQSINLDVKIGNNVVLWSGNHIGDCTIIKDHAWLSSHVCIAGSVTIESFCFLGNNCTISNKITIAEKSFIGAGALITKDTTEKGVYLAAGATKSPFDSERFFRMINID